MIIDYRNGGWKEAEKYSVFDANTGDQIGAASKERLFYADDEVGYYLRYRIDDNGLIYVWDERNQERIVERPCHVPQNFIRIAWERIDRKIVIRLKSDGPPVQFRQFL